MCGILGVVAPPGAGVGLDRRGLVAMRDAMASRGPDGAGLFEAPRVALGHRRLAIRDVEGGRQPWVAEDGQCVLVYNGELYNDAELRAELARDGFAFRSRCDTETVLAAYRRWGRRCVEHLRGMFAFGVYDFRDDSLLLARDRFGIKPLFLTEIGGRLVFASSVAALRRHPEFTAAPNMAALSHYLTTFRLTLGRDTLYQGVWQLLPGETLHLRDGRITIERYWDYPADEEPQEYAAAVDRLRELLTEAVRVRLASDVPVGMFLSGGVDSNVLACLLREITGRPLLGQCGGEAESADMQAARRAAAHVGFDFDEVPVAADDYRAAWQELMAQTALPLATPSDVVIYRLAQGMKKSVGVVLGGEGADELLCGYAVPHWSGHDYDASRQLADETWTAGPAAARLVRDGLQRQYGRARFASPADHYFALNSLIPTAAKPRLFQPWAWQAAGEDRPMVGHYAALLEESPPLSTDRRYLRLLHRVNLESLLARLDTATMQAGLEARVPFTDHRLVEQVFRLPQAFRIAVAEDEPAPYLTSGDLQARGSLRAKRVLRSVARRLMPAAMADRPKASFPTPVAGWLCGPWSDTVRERLRTSPFGQAVFQPHALTELADDLPRAGMWLWPLLNVLDWGDRQFAA